MIKALSSVILFFLIALTFVACGKHADVIAATGTIEATEVTVASQTTAVISTIQAEEGDLVKKGDVLALIDHEMLDIQLDDARASVSLAAASLNQSKLNKTTAQKDFQRIDDLHKKGSATDKQFDDASLRMSSADSQYQSAAATLEKAQAAVKMIQKKIRDCTVTAPLDGTVTHSYVDQGEYVMTGTFLFIIADLSSLSLTIYVTEKDLGKVKLGQKAVIAVDSYPNREFNGIVTYVSPTAEFTPKNIQTKEDRVKQVFAVKIKIENNDGVLKSGMPADATLFTGV